MPLAGIFSSGPPTRKIGLFSSQTVPRVAPFMGEITRMLGKVLVCAMICFVPLRGSLLVLHPSQLEDQDNKGGRKTYVVALILIF